jgi:hypothetical protein
MAHGSGIWYHESLTTKEKYMTEQKTHKRVNRFSGESIMLTREEAKKHDAIFYYEYMATEEDKKLGYGGSKLWDKVRANLNWFRQENPDAYMVLLD